MSLYTPKPTVCVKGIVPLQNFRFFFLSFAENNAGLARGYTIPVVSGGRLAVTPASAGGDDSAFCVVATRSLCQVRAADSFLVGYCLARSPSHLTTEPRTIHMTYNGLPVLCLADVEPSGRRVVCPPHSQVIASRLPLSIVELRPRGPAVGRRSRISTVSSRRDSTSDPCGGSTPNRGDFPQRCLVFFQLLIS